MSARQEDADKKHPRVITIVSKLFQAISHRRAAVLPLALIGLALLFLNWGLHKVFKPPEPFSTYTLPYSQGFEEVVITRWFAGGGDWTIRDGALMQADESIEAAQIFIPRWLVKGQPYRYSAQISLSDTAQAAGLSFNAQYPRIYSNHHRAIVARVLSLSKGRNGDQLELIAGYVDEVDGFQPQVSVPIPTEMQTLRLDVVVHEDTYDVQLNGQTMLEKRPLVYHDGLLGMYAAGGPVSFDNVVVSTAEDTAYSVEVLEVESGLSDAGHYVAGDLVYTSQFAGVSGGTGWIPFSGTWNVENGALTQSDTTGYDLGIGYEGDVFQNYALQVALSHIEGSGGGVLFNMATPYQHLGAHMVRYSDTADGVFWGYFENNGDFIGQGYAKVDTPGNSEARSSAHTFKILSGAKTYTIYLDDHIIARDIPLIRNYGYIGLITSRSAVAYHLVEMFGLLSDLWAETSEVPVVRDTPVATTGNAIFVEPEPTPTRTAHIVASDLVYTGDFVDASSDTGWIPIRGDWQVAGAQRLLTQVDPAGYDYAIGYEGNTFQSYALQVSLAHLEGVGGGVLFNMALPYQLNGAHMVRYSDRADAIFWGYYDDTGDFIGQGYASVQAPGDASHTFKITSADTSYAIDVDGQPVARDIPLVRNSGHIGLLTSRSAAAFGPIEVFTLGGRAEQPIQGTETGDLLGNLRIVSGDWAVDGSTIRQNSVETADFIVSTGVFAGVYSLETTITLPDDAELENVGGGIIFHMPDQDSKKNAHMVRLVGSSGGAFWGYFDENEVFIGQGWTTVSNGDSTTYNLKVSIQYDTYDLFINGEDVANDVQLRRRDGWIGLLSYAGPVVFSDIQVTVGGSQ